MKNMKNLRSILLAVVLMVVLAAMTVIACFYPTMNLPVLNVPNLTLVSIVVLLLENWLVPQGENCRICNLVLAVLSFAILPLAAGYAGLSNFWKLGLVGGGVFTLTALAMDSVRDRLASGPKAKGALIVTALGIYLASQCFAGILL